MSASTTERAAVLLALGCFSWGCGFLSSGSAGARTFEEGRIAPQPLWARDVGRGVEVTPLPWETSWFVLVTAGPLVRVAREDGADVWRAKLKGTVEQPPVVSGPSVVVVTEPPKAMIVALDLDTGKARWKRESPGGRVAGSREELLVVETSGRILRLNPGSGDVLWTARLSGAGWRAPALWAEEHLWLVPVRPDSVIALDSTTGARRWSRAVGAWPHVSARGARALAATDDGFLVSLHPADGHAVSRRSFDAAPAGPPTLDDDRALLALRNGKLIALDRAFQVIWERTLDPPLVSAPTLDGDDVFQAGPRGQVLRFTADRGEPLPSFFHSEFLLAAPAVQGDQVLVAGDGGTLIGFPREVTP